MKYIYAPAKHRRSGSTLQKDKARGSKYKYYKAREVLPGFPVTTEFETREQIEIYLNSEEITCLLCGKPYKNLGTHCLRVHKINADDYRFKFNIPNTYGLVGKTFRKHLIEHANKPNNLKHMSALGSNLTASERTNHRKPRRCKLIRQEASSYVNNPTVDKVRYKDWTWHLEMARKYFYYRTIDPPQGVASWSTFKHRYRKDNALRAAFNSVRIECTIRNGGTGQLHRLKGGTHGS